MVDMANTGINKEEVFRFLDGVRESGKINMFGTRPLIEDEFGTDSRTSKELLLEWMKIERRPQK